MSLKKIAVLYQALPPPTIDGLRKDSKPGGYSDGGADIAYTLGKKSYSIITPQSNPCAEHVMDWVFPDTKDGIEAALRAGATHLWLNTVLFKGHPIDAVPFDIYRIGQTTMATQWFDDKYKTNQLLRKKGLPVAYSGLVGEQIYPEIWTLSELQNIIEQGSISFPVVIKPVRGRGSQGVHVVYDLTQLEVTIDHLQKEQKFGAYFMVEELLKGEEITLTIMPPIPYSERWKTQTGYWSLRPVRRFNQKEYIVTYNGDVPVTQNSKAINVDLLQSQEMQKIIDACIKAAEIVGAKAPIRIDCRANDVGVFKIFDLNMKPNITGPGRPGREQQDCLSMIAARAEGWQLIDLLEMMIASAWRSYSMN